MLADLFGIASGTASRILITLILFLDKELSFLLAFPAVSDSKGIHIPASFRVIENLRGIIYCTEFYIEKPGRNSSQRSTFSSYKSRNTCHICGIGDVIVADKDFNVQDLFALKHVRLLAPPIMAKGNVSSKTTTMTSTIATARAHVELTIRKSKCFELITGVIPLTW